MPQSAFIILCTVSDINLEALAVEAGNIQDAVEAAGYDVSYVHPYARPSQTTGAPLNPFGQPGQTALGGPTEP